MAVCEVRMSNMQTILRNHMEQRYQSWNCLGQEAVHCSCPSCVTQPLMHAAQGGKLETWHEISWASCIQTVKAFTSTCTDPLHPGRDTEVFRPAKVRNEAFSRCLSFGDCYCFFSPARNLGSRMQKFTSLDPKLGNHFLEFWSVFLCCNGVAFQRIPPADEQRS